MNQCRSLLLGLLLALPLSSAFAQAFPNKPIRLITGNPPGTVIDGNVRMISPELEKSLGQPILIEHRTGANSTIAAQAAKNSPPDGYTLLLGSGPQASPLLNANNGVDVGREMVSVSMLVKAPYVLFARANLPFTNMAELIAYSKANPDKLKFGAASQVQDLVMAVIKSHTGITSISIPYRGSPPIVTALLADEVDIATSSAPPFLAHLQSGRMRAIMVATDRRMPILASTPTGFEVGVPADLGLFVGLWAPAGTPNDIVRRLSTAFSNAIKSPAASEQLRKTFGAEPIGSTPEELSRMFDADMKIWGEAVRATNFKPQP
jgi:tripartite-type tricarboxylate transporter receptor subunit TctC